MNYEFNKHLAFGMMRLPLNSEDITDINFDAVNMMVDDFIAAGFTYFDTATPYHRGACETAFRKCVAERYPRSAYVVTDKLTLRLIDTAEAMTPFFDAQLTNLGVDYIDYYLLHALDANSYKKATDFRAFDFVFDRKARGQIKHVGMSFHDKAVVLDKILSEHPELEFVQLQLNYLDWDDVDVEARKCYEVCVKHGKTVFVMEPVRGGKLVNIPEEAKQLLLAAEPSKSIASWALRFVASLENVQMVLSGMSNREQMLDNIATFSKLEPLSQTDYQLIDKVTAIIKKANAIPCTACRYCEEGCPKKILISDCFALYNQIKQQGEAARSSVSSAYAALPGKAADCIKCGQCEKVCPQHLKITDLLGAVKNTLKA